MDSSLAYIIIVVIIIMILNDPEDAPLLSFARVASQLDCANIFQAERMEFAKFILIYLFNLCKSLNQFILFKSRHVSMNAPPPAPAPPVQTTSCNIICADPRKCEQRTTHGTCDRKKDGRKKWDVNTIRGACCHFPLCIISAIQSDIWGLYGVAPTSTPADLIILIVSRVFVFLLL